MIQIPREGAVQSDSDSNNMDRSQSADDVDNMDAKQTMQQSKTKNYSKNRSDHHVKGQGLDKSKKGQGDARKNGHGKTEDKKGRPRVPKPKPVHKKVEKSNSGGTLPKLQ